MTEKTAFVVSYSSGLYDDHEVFMIKVYMDPVEAVKYCAVKNAELEKFQNYDSGRIELEGKDYYADYTGKLYCTEVPLE